MRFITGADFLFDGGATASYFYGTAETRRKGIGGTIMKSLIIFIHLRKYKKKCRNDIRKNGADMIEIKTAKDLCRHI